MVGLLGFNEISKRYFIKYDNSKVSEITSGFRIKIHYKDSVLESNIEHNGSDYFMTSYPQIGLKSLIASQADIC